MLCGEGGSLPVVLGIPAVTYESSSVCNDSDENNEIEESLGDNFWRF